MAGKSTEDSVMHRAATVPAASDLMKELWPEALGSVKARITKAARDLKWTVSRTEDMWRGEAKIIRGEETVRLLEIQAAKEARQKAEAEEMAIEYREFGERLARMEALLSALVSQASSAPPHAEKPRTVRRGASLVPRASTRNP